MYHIFYGNNIIFDPYGNENEVVTNASLNASINAASYLDFTMAITHPLYDVIAEKSGIVKLLWDDNVLFEGQIESIDIDIRGNKTISCVSALDYLNDTIVRPYSTISGERPLTAPSSVDGYFQWLIDQHNLHVKDSSKLFYVGVNQGANLQYNNFIYRSSNNNPTTASEITNQILDSLGGYLTMRYEDGLHVLDLYSDVHSMNAQVIDFGVNLKDFSKKIKTNEQYTALIAKGGSPQLLNGGFESGDFGYWETHPDTEITTAKAQEGSYSSYIIEGVATYIPKTFFYAKKNGRYKSTFYVKNERSSDVTVHAGYETNVLDSWSKASEQKAFVIKNDDQWHDCVFEFTVNVEDNTKVRPYWYSDNISNAGGARVYFDGFAFTRTVSGNPISEDPIDISLIPDGGTQYDSNVIKSDDVIYNPDRVSRYGYREKVFTDSTITDLDDLMQAAIKELNKLGEPTVGLDVKAVDLALYMDGYTHLTVGDAVRVRSAIHDTDEYLMVTSINLNLEDPGNSEYVIGQAYDSLTGQQSGYLRSLSSGINSSLDAVASLDETTKDQAVKIGSVTEVANKAQETADTANTKAENAQTAADNAQAAADSNKNAIDAANAEIEAAKRGITQAESEITTVNGRIDSMNDEIEAVNGSIDSANEQINTLNGHIETVSGNVDTLRNDLNTKVSGLNSQIETVSGSVDSLRTEVSTEVQNVKASVDAVSSKADSAMDKASVLAGNLEATDAIVHQHADKIGELTTSVSNATTKADSALQAATTATQTANEFKTTATTAYENAEEALTQSSTAVQKANEVSLNLSTNYQTKADSDALYATQASLKATSDSITSTVEKTYATKSSVESLQNIADSAIETWVGSVVPTGSNKPASDWTTSALKRQHSGDIYYDTSTGYSYRYGSTDGATYSWTMIKDSDIQKAIQDAADAQLTANGAKDSVDQLALDIPNIYATKTELTQTSDSIKASVSEVTKTANSALNKATTVEQTANGISATVSEQATKLDKTVTTVNKISAKADSISTSLTKTTNKLNGFMFGQLSNKGFETGDLSGWEGVDSIGTLYIDQTYVNTGKYSLRLKGPMAANGYIVSTDMFTITGGHKYKVSCYANGWYAQYYLKIGLRIGTNSATYQYITANLPSLASNLNFNKLEAVIEAPATLPNSTAKTYQGTICVGMARAWTAANNLYFDDFSIEDVTDLESANTNASEALAKASTIEQSVDSFKTSVTEKLNTTTSKLDSITSGKMNNLGFESGDTSGWKYNDSFGTLSIVSDWQVLAGKSSLKVNTPLSSGGYFKTTEWFYAIPGHTYKVSFILHPSSSNVVSFKLGAHLYKNGIGTYVTTTFTNVSSTQKRYEAIVEAPLKLNGGSYPNYQGYIYLEWTKNNTSKSNYVVMDEFDVEDITDLNKASSDAAAAIEKASTLEQTVDGFKTTVSQTYETKEDALKKESSVNQRVDSITSTVSEQATKLDQAVTTVSEVKQTADSLSSQISQATTDASNANDKATSALTKASSLEQSLNGFKTTVSQTYETKQDALNKQSTLNQTIDGFKTTVSQTYTTKTDFNNLQIGGTNRALLTGTPKSITGNNTINQCMRIYGMPSKGYELFGGDDVMVSYDITASGDTLSGTYLIQGNGNPGWDFLPSNPQGNLSDIGNGKTVHVEHKVKFSSVCNFDVFQIRMDYATGTLTISNFKIEKGNKATSWSPAPEDIANTYATKSEVTQTADSLTSKISQAATNASNANDKASSALTKASSLEQSLNGFKTTVSQTYETKTDSLAKQSTLNQKVDSLRSEVSETYATKTQLNNASSTTNMWPNQWFDTSKPCIGRAPVGNEIEAAPVGGNIRIIEHRDNWNGEVSSILAPGRKYKVSVDAKKVSGTNSVISGCIWYTVQSFGASWDGCGEFTKVKDYGNNWYRFERTVTVPDGKTMGTAWLQLLENSGSNNPAKWKISNLRFEDVTDIADIQANYSTKSYVDQTARTVSLGVVEEYKNGQHGSALATQSDISVAKDSITSTVSKTYTTISDFNNLQISGGRNIARDTKAFGRNNVTDKDTGYLRAYVDRTNGAYNGCTVRSLTSSDAVSQTVFEYGVNNVNLGEYYTMSFWAKGSGRMRLYCYGPSGYIGAKRIAASDGQAASDSYNDGSTDMTLSSGWKRYWVVWQLNDNPPGGYSKTKQFLLRNDNKMTSCDVCGVMIERGNKPSEWSPAPEDIEKTYATKSEVSQTADGLSVTISGIRDTANSANSTASTANILANNAVGRDGDLETCIKMTSEGVRVGQVQNSQFTGYSALVNAKGSYDILDDVHKLIAQFSKSGVYLAFDEHGVPRIMFNQKTKIFTDESGNTLATVSGANIDANTLFLNGQPVSMCETIFKILNYNTTGNFQYLNTNGSSRIKFDEISSSSVRRTAKLTNTKDVIEVTPGWYAITGVIDIAQDLRKSASIELRWMANDYSGSGFQEVSYLPSYMLLHDSFDIEKAWHRITLPVYHIYARRTTGIYPKILVTRHVNGAGNAAPDNITIGSRTYIQVTRMPFGNLES